MRLHAVIAEDAADAKLLLFQLLIWLIPVSIEAAPTTAAINENNTKNPVAALPIGKNIGVK